MVLERLFGRKPMVDVTQYSARTKTESLAPRIRREISNIVRDKYPKSRRAPAKLWESPRMLAFVAITYAASLVSTIVILAGTMR